MELVIVVSLLRRRRKGPSSADDEQEADADDDVFDGFILEDDLVREMLVRLTVDVVRITFLDAKAEESFS